MNNYNMNIKDLLELPSIFTGEFTCEEDVYNQFDTTPEPGQKILYAWYDTPSYEGYAEVLFVSDGKLYYITGSHCSCFGLEGQWEPEEITTEE